VFNDSTPTRANQPSPRLLLMLLRQPQDAGMKVTGRAPGGRWVHLTSTENNEFKTARVRCGR